MVGEGPRVIMGIRVRYHEAIFGAIQDVARWQADPSPGCRRGSGLAKLYILPYYSSCRILSSSVSENMSLLTKQGFAELELAMHAAGRCSAASVLPWQSHAEP
jgi:hypothetical protein